MTLTQFASRRLGDGPPDAETIDAPFYDWLAGQAARDDLLRRVDGSLFVADRTDPGHARVALSDEIELILAIGRARCRTGGTRYPAAALWPRCVIVGEVGAPSGRFDAGHSPGRES